MSMLLRRLLLTVAAMLALVFAACAATAMAISPSEALIAANNWRAEAGIPPIASMNPDWNTGCALHNLYMAANGLGHDEDPAKPYYTDAGSLAGYGSVLSEGEQDPKSAWSDAVYHRVDVLKPRLRLAGFDASHGFTCMQLHGQDAPSIDNSPAARTADLTLYTWPPDGAIDQPLVSVREIPDPIDEAGDDSLGYPISISVNGPWESQQVAFVESALTVATLTAQDGITVPVFISQRWNQGFQPDGTMGVFPLDPLRGATTYTVHVEGTITANLFVHYPVTRTDFPFNKTWSFRTYRDDAGGNPDALKLRLSGPRTQKLGRKGRIIVFARCGEDCTFALSGRLSVSNPSKSFRLRKVTKRLTAGKRTKVTLRPSKKAFRAAKRTLRRHKRVRAKLAATANDQAGNTDTAKRTLRLTR